jgi:hypothetical protein
MVGVRDFVILTDEPSEACMFCLILFQAIKLNDAPIDVVWYGSGDPREKFMETILGKKLEPSDCPVGIIKNHLFNGSRDILFMLKFIESLSD